MALFSHFVQVQTSEQTLFNFLILGKSRFPPKKFYNINYSRGKETIFICSEPKLFFEKMRPKSSSSSTFADQPFIDQTLAKQERSKNSFNKFLNLFETLNLFEPN